MTLHHRAWREAFAQAEAVFDFDWELFISRAGMGLVETVVQLNAQFALAMDPLQVVAWQRQSFHKLLPELLPIAAVVEHAKQARGLKCVASGGERVIVEQELSILGLDDIFTAVVCPDQVNRGKPDPEMFLLCAERMGLEPAECLVFEDGRLGLEAAFAAGMAWVAVDGSGRCGQAGERY